MYIGQRIAPSESIDSTGVCTFCSKILFIKHKNLIYNKQLSLINYLFDGNVGGSLPGQKPF